MLKRIVVILLLAQVAVAAPASGGAPHSEETCPPQSGVALQILGSGGPIADDARASTGYVVWVDGESRILIDAGGGTFLRFGEAGAQFEQLDFIGISHFHTDHSADLPALLKSGYFSKRERSLAISGPGPSPPFPGLSGFLDSMLDKESGAYAYLSGYLDGSGGLTELAQIEVDPNRKEFSGVFEKRAKNIQVDSVGVPHGIVPALAYRVRIGETSMVFAGDQNGNDDNFVGFAQDATLLIMHMPVPEDVAGAGRSLHAPPGIIGRIAADAHVKQLVLSHFMSRSLRELDRNVAIVRSAYAGPVVLANDLDCFIVRN